MQKKVAFLLYSTGFGGLEKKVLIRASQMAERGYCVSIFFRMCEGDEEIEKFCLDNRINFKRLKINGFIENWENRHLLKLQCFLRFIPIILFRPNFVYIPFNWTSHGMSFLWFCNLFKIQNIVSVHGFFPEVDNHSTWYSKNTEKIFANTKKVFAVSNGALVNFKRVHSERLQSYSIEYSVIPNWIDPPKFCFDPEFLEDQFLRMGIHTKSIVFGIVCRLEPIKRVDICLKFFKSFSNNSKYENSRLLIIGDGSLKEELVWLSKELGLEEKVQFLGFERNIEKLYSLIDVNILTSLSEGFGNTILEGMAAGCITVICDSPGMKELVQDGENGIIFNVEDIEGGVADLIAALSDEKTTYKLRVNAVKTSYKYDIGAIKTKFLELF